MRDSVFSELSFNECYDHLVAIEDELVRLKILQKYYKSNIVPSLTDEDLKRKYKEIDILYGLYGRWDDGTTAFSKRLVKMPKFDKRFREFETKYSDYYYERFLYVSKLIDKLEELKEKAEERLRKILGIPDDEVLEIISDNSDFISLSELNEEDLTTGE